MVATLLDSQSCCPSFTLACNIRFPAKQEVYTDEHPAYPEQVKAIMKSPPEQVMRKVGSEIIIGEVKPASCGQQQQEVHHARGNMAQLFPDNVVDEE